MFVGTRQSGGSSRGSGRVGTRGGSLVVGKGGRGHRGAPVDGNAPRVAKDEGTEERPERPRDGDGDAAA